MSGEDTDRIISELRAENALLRRQLAEALRKIAELTERLNQNSGNSSRPPSSDQAAPTPLVQKKKRRKGRKPGGQPGHQGHQRELVPVSAIAPEKLHIVRPHRCSACRHALTGTDTEPWRHQVWEAPEVKPEISEWQMHELLCRFCGVRTRAELPDGVPLNGYGPRWVATVALLTGAYHLSKRFVVDLMGDVLGAQMSLGSVTACERQASQAVAESVEQAREHLRNQGIKHADESSWFEGPTRQKVWLWVATTASVTVFLIHSSRGGDVARELLGSAFGVLVSDRWSAYNWWPLMWRQICWAHLERHFTSFTEASDPDAQRIGRALLRHHRRLFNLWHRVRDDTLKRSSFQTYASVIRRRVRKLLERGEICDHRKTAGTCAEILKLESAMWTFVRVDGVEPTNNHGERAIRPGVIWRKICFGTHSVEGSRFVERMLTVVHTLKQQRRNALRFVTESVAGMRSGQPGPSLLPAAA